MSLVWCARMIEKDKSGKNPSLHFLMIMNDDDERKRQCSDHYVEVGFVVSFLFQLFGAW